MALLALCCVGLAMNGLRALKAPEHVRTVDQFAPQLTTSLRAQFDAHFAEPRQAHALRFCWDYWHVPGQYTLVRTQAADYFEADDFERLTAALTAYGQEELGCRAITPPWLSFYVDGCEQALHADVPQGPFAYVLSLTDWESVSKRDFYGGETQILRPHVLNYWSGFDSSLGMERTDLVQDVEPLFDRLTVFDARIPHGVRRVEGTRDPRRARIVIHGWFCEAEPHFSGELDEDAVMAGLAAPLGRVGEQLSQPCVTGLLSVRVDVAPNGTVHELTVLADTLVVDPSQVSSSGLDARAHAIGVIATELEGMSFESSDGPSTITIPFVFD